MSENLVSTAVWEDIPVDISKESDFIWSIANKLRGVYMPDKYGDVIIPMTIIRRFESVLEKTKDKVVETFEANRNYPEKAMYRISGRQFYNTSRYNLEELCNDPDHLASNFKSYIEGFSSNVTEILNELDIYTHIDKMSKGNCLFGVVKAFSELDLSEENFDPIKMGYIFENLIGRFYQNVDAGQYYTGRDIIKMMVSVLTAEGCDDVFDEGKVITILDQACGTAGFLIAAMHDMLQKTDDDFEKNNIRKNQLFGIEDQSYMFTIATTNMILRGDGKSNLENRDFLKQNPAKLQLKGCTVGMMNPPYSQGSKDNPNLYEISFTEHLLKSLVEGARVAVIVPQSTMTGKTKYEKETKANILKKHTLEGVITLNKNTFYGVGTNPCIAIFTAGIPHHKDKICKFINFEDDGFEVAKHIGLVETPSAKDKKQHLLDVWFDRVEAETKFCVSTTIEADDEWLHSFYYFNDEIPTDEDFRNTIADYITFEVNMITHGREYLFGIEDEDDKEDEFFIDKSLLAAEDGEDYETK